MIHINSNGSRWGGCEPGELPELFAALATEPLHPRFDRYSCPAVSYRTGEPIHSDAPNAIRFYGNFFTVSHVFSVDTDDPETIAALTAAIDRNIASEAFQAAKSAC